MARMRSLLVGFHFGQVSQRLPRAPFFRIFCFFFGIAAPHLVLVVTTGYYRSLLDKDLLWMGMGLLFSMDQILLRKPAFAKNKQSFKKYNYLMCNKTHFSVLETFIFSNACAIHTVLENMGYW